MTLLELLNHRVKVFHLYRFLRRNASFLYFLLYVQRLVLCIITLGNDYNDDYFLSVSVDDPSFLILAETQSSTDCI